MQEENKNEVDKFFEGLPAQDKKEINVLEQSSAPAKEDDKKDESDNDDLIKKNRHHRRLEEKYQREREMNIALAERVKTLAEVRNESKESHDDLDPRLVEVFGDTDAGKRIAKHFGQILSETASTARDQALKDFEDQQNQVVEQQKEYESFIDSELESLEDKYNVDLTSDAPQARKVRREFLEMVQSLSPKDDSGTITGYADFDSTFDVYQKTRDKSKQNETVSRQKELASRTMQKSTSSGGQDNVPEGRMTFEKARRAIGLQ